jgi:hypothetical protein
MDHLVCCRAARPRDRPRSPRGFGRFAAKDRKARGQGKPETFNFHHGDCPGSLQCLVAPRKHAESRLARRTLGVVVKLCAQMRLGPWMCPPPARTGGTERRAPPDQNGRRSPLNGRKASSRGLRGCPWLRIACFVEAFFGFSTAGVSVGSGARAANSEATGETDSLDVPSVDGCSPGRTASRRIDGPSPLGVSTARGEGTTTEGAAGRAMFSTTL